MLDQQVKSTTTVGLLILMLAALYFWQPSEVPVVAPSHPIQVSYFERLLEEHAVPYEVVARMYVTHGEANWENLKDLRLRAQEEGLPVHFSVSNSCEGKVLVDFLTNRDALFEANQMPRSVKFTVLEKDHTELKLVLVRSDIRQWCTMRAGSLDHFSRYG
ncbi:MAG: hypothetical protein AAF699_05825 [Pseudomonadota bacterium]